jgi:hypothetical protein
MTSTDELEAKCKHIAGFAGVFADDELDQLLSKMKASNINSQQTLQRLKRPTPPQPFSAIVNYSPINDPRGGTHWVAFGNMLGTGPAQYFDSFGFSPDHDDVILSVGTKFRDFLRKVSATGTIDSNPYDLQAMESDTCGEWACYYVFAGSLPRLQAASGQPRFADPWSRFDYVRTMGKQSSPTRMMLANLSKDDDAAKRNDAIVRQWAGIVNPFLHSGGPGL